MARLTISGLHKFYGATHAVRGVDLDIPEGEFAVLVGTTHLRDEAALRAGRRGGGAPRASSCYS